ncbi:MAG: phytanoyl-CoA dioxygenase family protein [Pseudomonadales bacterium]|nr:phytanoyl-CoA dioxygenase family protein [Pseudomonadales bacterium]
MSFSSLNDIEAAAFERDGYIVVRNMVPAQRFGELRTIATDHLSQLIAPIEFEVDVGYPGAPVDVSSPGADTLRRLLQAFARDEAFRLWALDPEVKRILACLLQTEEDLSVSQCHHNCIMTKAPGFSSVTLWHQDSRYWAFDYENLVSVWLALGKEDKTNGCMRVIPGSHKVDPDSGRFDAAMFLRPDLSENKLLIEQAITVELNPGDVLFFHSRLFHAAGRNLSDETKLSVVFTYHQASNKPIKNTRSARFPSIVM